MVSCAQRKFLHWPLPVGKKRSSLTETVGDQVPKGMEESRFRKVECVGKGSPGDPDVCRRAQTRFMGNNLFLKFPVTERVTEQTEREILSTSPSQNGSNDSGSRSQELGTQLRSPTWSLKASVPPPGVCTIRMLESGARAGAQTQTLQPESEVS